MRKLVIVLGLAFATSVAVALSLWRDLQSERALTAQLRARQVPIAQRAAPPTPAAAPSSATPVSIAQPKSTTAGSAPDAAREVTGRKEDWQAYQRRLMQDPKYLEAWREQRRLTYRLRRDNAMRLFGFSPATADAIIDLDIDRELRMQDSYSASSSEEERQRRKAQYEADEREHDTKLLALLGQQRFDQWQNYMETRGTRMQVDRFRSQLNGADLLRDDQVEPLIAALAVEQKQMQTELQAFRESFDWSGDRNEQTKKFLEQQSRITKAGHERMLASAGAVLSTSQVRRFSDMLSTDLAQRDNQMRLDALRQKLGPMPAPDDGSD